MNYYILLGVPLDADQETIRSAFRMQVRRYHPDAGEGSSAEKFRQLVEAYTTLNDPMRRRLYDRTVYGNGPSGRTFIGPRVMPVRLETTWTAVRLYPPPADLRWRILLDDLFDDVFESMDDWISWRPSRRRY